MILQGSVPRSAPAVLGLLLICLVAAGCGQGPKAGKVYRIQGADAAWNATRLMPGRALYKSQPIWDVEARPGDVLGLRILDFGEDSGFGLEAQFQVGADLYYLLPEGSPTMLGFTRTRPSCASSSG